MSGAPAGPGADRAARHFRPALAAVLALGFVHRLAYVVAQPAVDPTFDRPMLDGLVYLDWARNILAGASYEGAYYLAPLYPFLLAGWLRVLGESFALLYLLQHVAVLAAAGLLAVVARRSGGAVAGLFTAALAVLYQPLLFFASTPVAEAIVLLPLTLSLWVLTGKGRYRHPITGLLLGLAALGRPNLLLLALGWAALAGLRRRPRAAALILVGAAVAVLPVMVRNQAASGHAVPISANSGITAYHGNGPGANGTYTQPAEFSGSPLTQRAEATAVASRLTGQPLDAVDADRYWGREAVRARLADPLGTLSLLALRAALTIDTHEHGLDYDPLLDRNPWRATWRMPRVYELPLVPLALLLGLAVAGVVLRGLRGTGGPWVWCAILACAATPILFYVSSRYRLPAVTLLSVPAGCGAAALFSASASRPGRRRDMAIAVGLLCTCASLMIPSGALKSAQRAQGLTNLASAHKAAGRLDEAEMLGREALALAPRSARVRYNLAVVLEARGRLAEAESEYRAALDASPGLVEAAGNLAALLIRRGAPQDAIPWLRRALALRPEHGPCWTNLVVALALEGRLSEARDAAREARDNGVSIDPELLHEIREAHAGDSVREESLDR